MMDSRYINNCDEGISVCVGGLITPPGNPCGVHMDSRTPWMFHGFHGCSMDSMDVPWIPWNYFWQWTHPNSVFQSMDNPHITMIFIIFMESMRIVHGLHM